MEDNIHCPYLKRPQFIGRTWLYRIGACDTREFAIMSSRKGIGQLVFFDGPSEFSFGEPVRCRLILDWFPEADYSPLVKGATFTVREGAKIVGHGVVLERSDVG